MKWGIVQKYPSVLALAMAVSLVCAVAACAGSPTSTDVVAGQVGTTETEPLDPERSESVADARGTAGLADEAIVPASSELVSLDDIEDAFFGWIEADRFRDPDAALVSDLARLDLSVLGIDEGQADALADGVVTLDEYRTQVERAAECVAETGLRVQPVYAYKGTYGVQTFSYTFGNQGTGISDPEMFRLADHCQARYSFLVHAVYGLQNNPTREEERQIRLDVARAAWPCMIEAGLRLDDFDVEALSVDDAEQVWQRASRSLDLGPSQCLNDLFFDVD